MPEFEYHELLPLGKDTTPYRLVTTEGVSTFEADGKTFLKIDPAVIRLLTAEAMHDIAHLLRAGHLHQLRNILDDDDDFAKYELDIPVVLLDGSEIARHRMSAQQLEAALAQ